METATEEFINKVIDKMAILLIFVIKKYKMPNV